jgi:hypothetical protein
MMMKGQENMEYAGLLQRDTAGLLLQCDDGRRYRIETLRTPIDEVEKRVVVTGRVTSIALLEADGIRLA